MDSELPAASALNAISIRTSPQFMGSLQRLVDDAITDLRSLPKYRLKYCNVLAEVISVIHTNFNSTVLRIWDGQQHGFENYDKVFRVEPAMIFDVAVPPSDDRQLISHQYYIDVIMYGDWATVADNFASGDIVLLSNLHVSLPRGQRVINFVMHEGRIYNRGLFRLDDDQPEGLSVRSRTIDVLGDLRRQATNRQGGTASVATTGAPTVSSGAPPPTPAVPARTVSPSVSGLPRPVFVPASSLVTSPTSSVSPRKTQPESVRKTVPGPSNDVIAPTAVPTVDPIAHPDGISAADPCLNKATTVSSARPSTSSSSHLPSTTSEGVSAVGSKQKESMKKSSFSIRQPVPRPSSPSVFSDSDSSFEVGRFGRIDPKEVELTKAMFANFDFENVKREAASSRQSSAGPLRAGCYGSAGLPNLSTKEPVNCIFGGKLVELRQVNIRGTRNLDSTSTSTTTSPTPKRRSDPAAPVEDAVPPPPKIRVVVAEPPPVQPRKTAGRDVALATAPTATSLENSSPAPLPPAPRRLSSLNRKIPPNPPVPSHRLTKTRKRSTSTNPVASREEVQPDSGSPAPSREKKPRPPRRSTRQVTMLERAKRAMETASATETSSDMHMEKATVPQLQPEPSGGGEVEGEDRQQRRPSSHTRTRSSLPSDTGERTPVTMKLSRIKPELMTPEGGLHREEQRRMHTRKSSELNAGPSTSHGGLLTSNKEREDSTQSAERKPAVTRRSERITTTPPAPPLRRSARHSSIRPGGGMIYSPMAVHVMNTNELASMMMPGFDLSTPTPNLSTDNVRVKVESSPGGKSKRRSTAQPLADRVVKSNRMTS